METLTIGASTAVNLRPYSHETFLAIKRYCDKKNIFEPQVSFGQGKLLAQGTLYSFHELTLVGYGNLWLKSIFLFQYLFISLSQYCVPKCLV